jgi:hypothetical protein
MGWKNAAGNLEINSEDTRRIEKRRDMRGREKGYYP